MIWYAVKQKNQYLQGIEPNEKYNPYACAPMGTNRHLFNEWSTIWGKEPKRFEHLTLANYIKVLLEEQRWGARTTAEFKIIPIEEV